MAESQNGVASNGVKKAETSSQRHEEHQYLDLVREILDDGEHRPDRFEDFNLGTDEFLQILTRAY